MGFATTFRFGAPFFLEPTIDELIWRTHLKDNFSIVHGSHPSNTVSGDPILELQTDLRDIGYFAPLNGHFDARTEFAVMMFQKHFFSGSRRTLIHAGDRGTVNRITAEFIKRVRP